MSKLLIFLIGCLIGSASGLEFFNILNNYDREVLRDVVSNSSVSEVCQEDMKEYFSTLKNLTLLSNSTWALQMLDSSAKIPIGLLSASLTHIGQFDECLSVVHPSGRFQGQHCMMTVNLSFAGSAKFLNNVNPLDSEDGEESLNLAAIMPMTLGFCLPSTCSAKDLNGIMGNMPLIANLLSADDNNCWTSEPRTFSDGSWAFLSVVIILLVLVVLSSAYEIWKLINNETPNKLFSAFSAYSNTKSMLEIRDSSGEMACLHGIRTFSMMWVVLCHVYMQSLYMPVINMIDISTIMNSVSHILITNGFYSVDSFFFLSGLLVAFVFFRNIGRKGAFDAPTAYIHRFLRLTPAFLFMVIFNMTVFPDLDKGPLWYSITSKEAKACEDNWWSSILYVQNYVNPLTNCLGQSWYLSADMQMFWISPLILYPLYLWPTFGVALLAILTIASTLWTFGIDYTNKFQAAMIQMTNQDQFALDYVATHTRIMPWLVGIGLGFLICAIKARRITVRLSKKWVILGWVVSTGTCLGCLYGIDNFHGDNPAGAVDASFYLSFTRTAWGLGLAWIVFACVYGYGGIVNSFLSMGIFQPLGKLSFNVYLVHQTLLEYRIGTMRTNVYISDFNMVYEFLATLVLSYLFAMVIYLLVEAPTAVIDRELLKNVEIFPYPRPQEKQKSSTVDYLEKGQSNSGFEETSETTNTSSLDK